MTNQEQEIMEILEEWDLTRCAWAAAELGSVTPRRSNSSSFFIEVGSRRVHLAGCTYNPSPVWVVQQAWNLAWKLQDGIRKAKLLLRDRDSKVTVTFDEVFKSEGVEVIQLPFRAPRASAYSERWVRTVRWEVLDGMLIFRPPGPGESVLVEFINHYNRARPHQGIEQRQPCEPTEVVPLPTGPVQRRDRLGGIIHEYCRAA